jgi:RHS repeat-associated protein
MPESTDSSTRSGCRVCMVASAILLSASACTDPGALRSDQLEPDVHTRYHVQDRLGSAALVLDNEGKVVARSAHKPYGERWVDWHADGEGSPVYRFTDKEEDLLSGAIYIGARHYLPALGRWTSPDPLLLYATPDASPGHAIQANPYGYAANNPVDLVDPDGHAAQAAVPAVVGVVAAGAALGAAGEIAAQLINGNEVNWGKVGTAAVVGGALAPLAAEAVAVRVGVAFGLNIGKSAFDTVVIDGKEVDPVDLMVDGALGCVELAKGSAKAAKRAVGDVVENVAENVTESVAKSRVGTWIKNTAREARSTVAPEPMTMEFDDPMPSSGGSEYTIPDTG